MSVLLVSLVFSVCDYEPSLWHRTVPLMSRIDRSNENSEVHEIYKRHHKNPENSEISKILRLLFI